jgi:hypothetical protein
LHICVVLTSAKKKSNIKGGSPFPVARQPPNGIGLPYAIPNLLAALVAAHSVNARVPQAPQGLQWGLDQCHVGQRAIDLCPRGPEADTVDDPAAAQTCVFV